MSTTQHTPGRVYHDKRGFPYADIKSETGRNVACTWGINRQPKTREAAEQQKQIARANARRIVACWNALIDEDTEHLERLVEMGTTLRKEHEECLRLKEMYQVQLNKAEAQRDELLKALSEAKEALQSFQLINT